MAIPGELASDKVDRLELDLAALTQRVEEIEGDDRVLETLRRINRRGRIGIAVDVVFCGLALVACLALLAIFR